MAAFAVSGYASSYFRSGHKPFNPLLGETYECIRADRGWKFIAEQVTNYSILFYKLNDLANGLMIVGDFVPLKDLHNIFTIK